VGDTLSEANKVRFTGLPNFAPEILRRVQLKDPTKTKQLRKALDDLSEEGVIQVFYPEIGSQWVVGVVGQLQLDVLISRLQAEYKVEAALEGAPFDTARWVKGMRRLCASLPSSTAPIWPRIAMARWCSWRVRPGTCPISRNAIRR
jgi:peptide chain release factor 3